MKQTVYVSSNFGVSKQFDADALPGQEARAQSDALLQAVEFLNAELVKRLEESPEVSRREGG